MAVLILMFSVVGLFVIAPLLYIVITIGRVMMSGHFFDLLPGVAIPVLIAFVVLVAGAVFVQGMLESDIWEQ